MTNGVNQTRSDATDRPRSLAVTRRRHRRQSWWDGPKATSKEHDLENARVQLEHTKGS